MQYGNGNGGYGSYPQNNYSQSGYGQQAPQNPYTNPYANQDAAAASDDPWMTWNNCEVDEASDFVVLKPGKYKYVITHWDKGRYEGSDKMPPCPLTIIHCQIETEEGPVTVEKRIFMTEKSKWQGAQLFKSIGAPVINGKVQIDWNKLNGASGWLEIENKQSAQNPNVVFNNIKKFLPPEN